MFTSEDIADPFSRKTKSSLTIVDVASGRSGVVPVAGDAAQGQWLLDGRLIAYWSNDGRRIATGFSEGESQDLSLKGNVYDVDPSWFEPGTTMEPITVEPSIEATPAGWSPDDRYLKGWAPNEGVVQFAVYEVRSRELTILGRADGRPFRAGSKTPGWLDRTRLLLWDDEGSVAYVVHVETGASRQIAELQGPAEFSAADGGKTLYSLRSARESDIWLLSLDDATDQR